MQIPAKVARVRHEELVADPGDGRAGPSPGRRCVADGRLERFEHPLGDRRVNAVAVESVAGGGRRVWVGTARGLAMIEDGGRVVRLLTTADALPDD